MKYFFYFILFFLSNKSFNQNMYSTEGGDHPALSVESIESYMTLPSQLDLSSKLPYAGDQGKKGSCWAWAAAYVRSAIDHQQGEPLSTKEYPKYSPEYIYQKLSKKQNCDKVRVNAWEALEFSLINPLLEYNEFPPSENCYIPINFNDKSNLSDKRTVGWYKVRQLQLNDLKKYLISHNLPAIISLRVDEKFKRLNKNNPKWENPGKDGLENHAVIVVGYNGDYFKVLNSHGRGWGEKGYGWIHKSIIEDDYFFNYIVGVVKTSERSPEPRNEENNDRGIAVSAVFKEGYYIELYDLKINLNQIDLNREYITIRIESINNDVRYEDHIVKYNENNGELMIEFNKNYYKFKVVSIFSHGFNRLKKAVRFELEKL